MKEKRHITADQDALGEALANLACEGMVLSPEDEAFLRSLEDEELSEDESISRIKAYLQRTRAPR